jgi:hypothetical protein
VIKFFYFCSSICFLIIIYGCGGKNELNTSSSTDLISNSLISNQQLFSDLFVEEDGKIDYIYINNNEFLVDPQYICTDNCKIEYFCYSFDNRNNPLYLADISSYGYPKHQKLGCISFDFKSLNYDSSIGNIISPLEVEFHPWVGTPSENTKGYGTGSLIENNGKVYWFYGSAKISMASANIDHEGRIGKWEKYDLNGDKVPDYVWDGTGVPIDIGIRPANRFLDPYVFFDNQLKKYIMLYIAEDVTSGNGAIGYNISSDLINWNPVGRLKIPNIFSSGGPEVPQLLYAENKYWLFVSYFSLTPVGLEQVTKKVKNYRDKNDLSRGELVFVADALDGDFRLTECSRFLDNKVRYASRIYNKNQQFYLVSMINGTLYDKKVIPKPLAISFVDDCILLKKITSY